MISRPTSHSLLRNVTAGSAWGILPLKNPEHAKTRLSAALTSEERRTLFRAMAEDVLAALCGADGLEGTVVVTRDTWAQALAERYGAAVLEEPANRGQSPAVAAAAAALAGAGAGAGLALPGDVPLVSPAEIDRVLAAHGPPPFVTLAPAGRRPRGPTAWPARRPTPSDSISAMTASSRTRPKHARLASSRASSRGFRASRSMWTSPGICACCSHRAALAGRSHG